MTTTKSMTVGTTAATMTVVMNPRLLPLLLLPPLFLPLPRVLNQIPPQRPLRPPVTVQHRLLLQLRTPLHLILRLTPMQSKSPHPIGLLNSLPPLPFSLTWFTQDGNAGACGIVHSDSDFIAALDSRTYGDSGSQSSLCGKQIRISWQGKSVDVTVADDCPTCNTPSSVDLSQAAFEALSSLDTGLLTGGKSSPSVTPPTLL